VGCPPGSTRWRWEAVESDDFFCKIVELETGQAIVFSPLSLHTVQEEDNMLDGPIATVVKRFNRTPFTIRTRSRITHDGGVSLTAAASAGNTVFTEAHPTPTAFDWREHLDSPSLQRTASGLATSSHSRSGTASDLDGLPSNASFDFDHTASVSDETEFISTKPWLPAGCKSSTAKAFVPAQFKPLVAAIQAVAQATHQKDPLMSGVGFELIKTRGKALAYSGFSGFKQYLEAAQRANILRMVVGVGLGSERVSLCSGIANGSSVISSSAIQGASTSANLAGLLTAVRILSSRLGIRSISATDLAQYLVEQTDGVNPFGGYSTLKEYTSLAVQQGKLRYEFKDAQMWYHTI
jgi:hypothetical protein